MTKTPSLFLQDAQLGKRSRRLGIFKYDVVDAVIWSSFEEGTKMNLYKLKNYGFFDE